MAWLTSAFFLLGISALAMFFFKLGQFSHSRNPGRTSTATTRSRAVDKRGDAPRSEHVQIAHLQAAAMDLTKRRALHDSQLAALRNQMNPHFIFNTLNGICADVLAGRTLRGRTYLTAFRELVTGVMRQAEAGWISIDEEICTLKRYIEIESLRLDQHIEFACPQPHTFDLAIPSLLLQPLIENAIWHGLRHLPQGVPAVLGLSIHEVRDGLIEIQIQDNGLPEGFADTPDAISVPVPVHPEGDAKKARRHASDIIRQRLQLLDNLGDCRLNIASTNAGTTSRLTLPTRHV